MEMQIYDILILANNDFPSIKKDVIRLAKIKIKVKKHLIFIHLLKFNNTQIKLDS